MLAHHGLEDRSVAGPRHVREAGHREPPSQDHAAPIPLAGVGARRPTATRDEASGYGSTLGAAPPAMAHGARARYGPTSEGTDGC